MTDAIRQNSGRRNYGTTPVSVFRSLVVDADKDMSLCERGLKVAETLYQPEIMTLDEFFSYTCEFSDGINEVRHTRDKDKIKSLKKHKFPCACISAVIKSRSDSMPEDIKIESYNSLVVLNIDNLENPEETKRLVSTLPFIFYVGLSVGGHGLFAIVPVETTDYHQHRLYFEAIREVLEGIGIAVDDSGANPCWTRLASIDNRAYRNDNCAVFTLGHKKEPQREHYKGKCSKHQCPACGQRTFVRYIDVETGEYLSEDTGRCDRECNCGYHKKPKDFFAEGGARPEKAYWFPKPSLNHSLRQSSYSTISRALVEESMGKLAFNNFNIWLREHFDSAKAMEACIRYNVGGHNLWTNSTVFWQIDQQNRVHAGKIMLYDYHTGHRVKSHDAKVCWVHSLTGFKDFNLRQCLFGLHLLRPEAETVAVVESEKTAVVANMFFPNTILLATGGLTNLRTAQRQARDPFSRPQS